MHITPPLTSKLIDESIEELTTMMADNLMIIGSRIAWCYIKLHYHSKARVARLKNEPDYVAEGSQPDLTPPKHNPLYQN